MALTVPEVARRIGRNPETVRRWIREGKLRSTKVGTQHLVEERDLVSVTTVDVEAIRIPIEWRRTFWGESMPDVVSAVHRSRAGH